MRLKTSTTAAITLCLMVCFAVPLFAQYEKPKADIWAGYSWIKPDTTGYSPTIPGGLGMGVTVNPGRHFGINFDYSVNHTLKLTEQLWQVGPKFTIRGDHFMPFFEAMAGIGNVSSGYNNFNSTGFAASFGGGLDIRASQHFGIRLVRADWGPVHLKDGTDTSLRIETGLLFFLGNSKPPVAPTATCSVTPSDSLSDETAPAFSVSATPTGFNPKHTLTYSWTTSGGKVVGNGSDASSKIDVTGAAPGSYSAKATITDPKQKQNNVASCTANFTVKTPQPPAVTCSASTSSIQAGSNTPVTITANISTPDKRAISSRNWTSTGGTIKEGASSADSSSATLDTTNVQAGTVTATVTVTDSRGLTGNCSASVTVTAPPPPANPIEQDLMLKGKTLLDVHFDFDKSTIRPESEPLLQSAADVLSKHQELSVYVDGYTDSKGTDKYNLALSKRRAASVKDWLTGHGVDASRLDSRGFGETNPVADNKTDEGRQKNRRVELVVMTDEQKAAPRTEEAPAAPVKHHKKAAAKK